MELAWHIASVDVWFLNSIAELNFGSGSAEMPATIKTGKDIAAWYEPAIKAGIARVEAMSAEQLGTPVDFFGMFNSPPCFTCNSSTTTTSTTADNSAPTCAPWAVSAPRFMAAARMNRWAPSGSQPARRERTR